MRPDLVEPAERVLAYADGRIKDIENRGWSTKVRGRILVHAGKTYSLARYQEDREYLHDTYRIDLPRYEEIPRGGIVGTVDIVDCVDEHPSRWKSDGSWGFVLANATPLRFRPLRGALGFFGVPDSVFAA